MRYVRYAVDTPLLTRLRPSFRRFDVGDFDHHLGSTCQVFRSLEAGWGTSDLADDHVLCLASTTMSPRRDMMRFNVGVTPWARASTAS